MKLRHAFQLCHHVEDYPLDFSQVGSRNDLKWVAEFKFDGQLAMLIDGRLWSRKSGKDDEVGNDITDAFPEIQKFDRVVLVGEIIVATKENPTGDFRLILQRKLTDKAKIRIRSQTIPATYNVFDILELDGEDLTSKSFGSRRAILEEWFAKHSPRGWELVDQIEVRSASDVEDLREKAYELGIEGFIFKRLSSAWHSGKRSSDFLKLKTVKEEDFKIESFEETVGDKGNAGFVVFIRNSAGELQKVAIGSEEDRAKVRSRQVKVIEVKYLRKSKEGVLYQPVLSKLKEDF